MILNKGFKQTAFKLWEVLVFIIVDFTNTPENEVGLYQQHKNTVTITPADYVL